MLYVLRLERRSKIPNLKYETSPKFKALNSKLIEELGLGVEGDL